MSISRTVCTLIHPFVGRGVVFGQWSNAELHDKGSIGRIPVSNQLDSPGDLPVVWHSPWTWFLFEARGLPSHFLPPDRPEFFCRHEDGERSASLSTGWSVTVRDSNSTQNRQCSEDSFSSTYLQFMSF